MRHGRERTLSVGLHGELIGMILRSLETSQGVLLDSAAWPECFRGREILAEFVLHATPGWVAFTPQWAKAERLIREFDWDAQIVRIKGEAAAAVDGEQREHATADAKTASHSPDFRSVKWFGVPYTFTTNQAKCVALLWRAWENGTPDMDGMSVVTDADVQQARFLDVFKSRGKMHSAWKTMIVSQAKGAYRLAEPADVVSTNSRKSPRKTPRKKNKAS